MKFFRKTWVAVVLSLVMIVGAVAIGQLKDQGPATTSPKELGLDSSLSTSQYEQYLMDEAGVLSSTEEKRICLYNANWVQRYDSLIAVAVLNSVDGTVEDYAYELSTRMELASTDAVLVIETSSGNSYLAVGPDYPMGDNQITSYMNSYLYADVMNQKYGVGILNLFQNIIGILLFPELLSFPEPLFTHRFYNVNANHRFKHATTSVSGSLITP